MVSSNSGCCFSHASAFSSSFEFDINYVYEVASEVQQGIPVNIA